MLMKQLEKTVNKLAATEDEKERKGILAQITIPAQKEWAKEINRLTRTAVETGILRSHYEIGELRKQVGHQFNEYQPIVTEDLVAVLPKEAIEYLRTYSFTIAGITDDTTLDRIRNTINRGLEDGISVKQMMKEIQETTDTWMSDWRSETIARTESIKMYNAGRIARYMDPELGDFIQALQYDAITDTRTTDICRHLDGKIIAITDQANIQKYTPPNHFSCRASWLPVSKYEDVTPNWDDKVNPATGFQTGPPIPRLIQNATEPIVQPKKKALTQKELLAMTDEAKVRALKKADFDKWVDLQISKGGKDFGELYPLIKERAEKEVFGRGGLLKKNAAVKIKHEWLSTGTTDMPTGTLKFFIDEKRYMIGTTKAAVASPEFKKMVSLLESGKMDEVKELLEEMFNKDPMGWRGFRSQFLRVNKIDTSITKGKLPKAAKGTDAQMKQFFMRDLRGTYADDAGAGRVRLQHVQFPTTKKFLDNEADVTSKAREAIKWFKAHTDPKMMDSFVSHGNATGYSGVRMHLLFNRDRSFAVSQIGSPNWGVYVGAGVETRVYVHEIAHLMAKTPRAASASKAWFAKRIEGYDIEEIYQGSGEIGYRDNFFTHYVGKVYEGDGLVGTEVVSMGMEAMYADPVDFYQKDPDHFMFIYSLMRGWF
ncbi:hypothetical protein EG878_14795 [Enterococcus faecalis]|nr:hypothetical protein EG878_14795 [Enterococcus faecalis]